jgi:uncharacterized repeat protein (TIGR03847 family)
MSQEHQHARYDLGVCAVLEPEAIGASGSRRFRLRVAAENGTALLWLEKEELHELALTVKRMLGTPVEPTGGANVLVDGDTRADFDFKVAGLALAFDRDSGRYMIIAQVTDEDEDDGVALWSDVELLNRMADRAIEVHDGGRPRCALCGAPLRGDGSHVCPRAN